MYVCMYLFTFIEKALNQLLRKSTKVTTLYTYPLVVCCALLHSVVFCQSFVRHYESVVCALLYLVAFTKFS